MSDEKDIPADEEETHISIPNYLERQFASPVDDEPTAILSATTVHDEDATVIANTSADVGDSWGDVSFSEIEDLDATAVKGPTDTVMEFPDLAPSSLPEGYVVNNRFVISELLGVGGMGVVYRAVDKRKEEAQDRDPYVAIKILGEKFKRFPKAFVALQREARKSQSLAHPNVITVYDFDRDGDLVYMTMEQLSGSPMDDLIKANPSGIEPARAEKIINGIAQGLAYAHSKGIVHSDLKPGNVFVLPDDTVKILDFGIARAATGAASESGDKTVFDAGEIGGLTPTYASLEMFQGADPHPSDDIYALGIMAYELYAGEHPYGRKSAKVAVEKGLKVKPLKGIKRHQWTTISRALVLTRDKRLPDAQTFLQQFAGMAKGIKWLAGALVLSLAILVAVVSFRPDVEGPEIPFEELPIATQAEVASLLGQADEALTFGDMDGALYLLNEAYSLHPGNFDVAERFERVVDVAMTNLAASDFDSASKLQRVDTLLAYPGLAANDTLLAEKAQLLKGQ